MSRRAARAPRSSPAHRPASGSQSRAASPRPATRSCCTPARVPCRGLRRKRRRSRPTAIARALWPPTSPIPRAAPTSSRAPLRMVLWASSSTTRPSSRPTRWRCRTWHCLERHLVVNLRAPVLLASAFLAQWQGAGDACVINLLDQRVLRPDTTFFSLHAVEIGPVGPPLRSWRRPSRPKGVRVNAVGPGPVFPNTVEGREGFASEGGGGAASPCGGRGRDRGGGALSGGSALGHRSALGRRCRPAPGPAGVTLSASSRPVRRGRPPAADRGGSPRRSAARRSWR